MCGLVNAYFYNFVILSALEMKINLRRNQSIYIKNLILIKSKKTNKFEDKPALYNNLKQELKKDKGWYGV